MRHRVALKRRQNVVMALTLALAAAIAVAILFGLFGLMDCMYNQEAPTVQENREHWDRYYGVQDE